MINNFGQTPTQLLTEPHPKRMNREEARERRMRHSVIPGNFGQSVFCVEEKLKAHSIQVEYLNYFYTHTQRSQFYFILFYLCPSYRSYFFEFYKIA